MEPRISIITLGVSDLGRSHRFYVELGLPTSGQPSDGIVFFETSGTRLALFPLEALATDAGMRVGSRGFPGITLAHNVRRRAEVDEVLAAAVRAGGTLVDPAHERDWGGYSGYVLDPDGYPWEIAWADSWEFNEDGSLVV